VWFDYHDAWDDAYQTEIDYAFMLQLLGQASVLTITYSYRGIKNKKMIHGESTRIFSAIANIALNNGYNAFPFPDFFHGNRTVTWNFLVAKQTFYNSVGLWPDINDIYRIAHRFHLESKRKINELKQLSNDDDDEADEDSICGEDHSAPITRGAKIRRCSEYGEIFDRDGISKIVVEIISTQNGRVRCRSHRDFDQDIIVTEKEL
jgi:hypothetical protein